MVITLAIVIITPKFEAQISYTACDWKFYPFHIILWKATEVTLTANYEWLKETVMFTDQSLRIWPKASIY